MTTFDPEQDSSDILRHVVERYGEDILLDATELNDILAKYLDYAAPDIPAIRIAVEAGIGEYLYDAVDQDDKTRRKTLKAASRLLIDELGYSRDRSKNIISALKYALRMDDPAAEMIRLLELSVVYIDQENYSMFIKCLKGAVRRGYKGDYSPIGVSEILGSTGVKVDCDDGFKWALRCYRQWRDGDIESLYNVAQLEFAIGLCYLTGQGTSRNVDQGTEFWRAAIDDADESDLQMISGMGHAFRAGNAEINGREIQIEPNYQLALQAYQKATRYGDRDSIYYLGEMNERGQGVHGNLDVAKLFYERAAELGDQEAIEWLEKN